MARELLEIDDARSAVLERVRRLPSEPVALRDARGRVLAQQVVAAEPVPGYDGSAMDGFALRAADTVGASADDPRELLVVGESRAGTPSDRALGVGEAIAISTGAVVPEGADAVLRVEDTSRDGARVSVRVEVGEGNDIRRAGEDIEAGDVVLGPGALIGAVELGVLASLNAPSVECAKRPAVAIVATGDELLEPGEPGKPGGVRNSNSYVLPALAGVCGAEPRAVARTPDDAGATRDALSDALSADLTIVCGGVSVGEHDHVRPALEELGVEQVFWGVSLRPGKPTYFGVRERERGVSLVLALPGNPVSALVTFLLFARPALLAMQGASAERRRIEARLAREQPRMKRRTQAVRCTLDAGPAGWLATPTGPQGSHILTSLLGADGLAIIEPGEGAAAEGDPVTVELLDAA